MKYRFIKIIHILLGFAIVGMVIAYIIKPIWFMECVTIISIIAFSLFALEILVCHFSTAYYLKKNIHNIGVMKF